MTVGIACTPFIQVNVQTEHKPCDKETLAPTSAYVVVIDVAVVIVISIIVLTFCYCFIC